jgi:glycosyltransferase involved in cell wall biosynthesis
MRIGIDARTLSGHYTGDRTYWRGLIGGLATIDTENEYLLYTRQPVQGTPPACGPNFQWRQIPRPANNALWMLQAFPRALAEDGIDVAHTQYNIPLLGVPCPVVTTVHDVSFALFPDLFLPRDRWILKTFVPRSMAKAARVIADSESTRRDILRLYKSQIPSEKVVTILLAADARFQPPQNGQESAWKTVNTRISLENQPYILSVGVLQPRKNLGVLLDAFALVKLGPHKLPHKLVIAGKRGWLGEELDRQVAELPSEVLRDVIWAGYVPDDDLPALYGGAEAFCYPSKYEGFGLPPLEAMACGCPVLCIRASSIPEVVGDAAVLLPPDDSGAWAAALEKLLAQPQVRERWRERGLERARRFSWEQTARKTLRVYEESLHSQ